MELTYFETVAMLRTTKMSWIETMKKAKAGLVLMGLILCAWTSLAQGSIEVDGTVRNKDTNQKLGGVTVEVLQNGGRYDAVRTNSSGKYNLSLDHGSDYVLVFTLDDLSERRVEVNTSTIPDEFRERPFYLTCLLYTSPSPRD